MADTGSERTKPQEVVGRVCPDVVASALDALGSLTACRSKKVSMSK